MDNWLERFTDEELHKRRENIYYLTCWLYTMEGERNKRRYDDMMEQLKEVDAEIERRRENGSAADVPV